MTNPLPDEFGDKSPAILRDCLWNGDAEFFNETAGKQRVTLAKALAWDDYEFAPKDGNRHPRAVILEEINNTTLAILAPDGTVYQLGDTIKFEASGQSHSWYRSRRDKTHTVEKPIDYLSSNHVSVSRLPTYSNVPDGSPSANPSTDDISIQDRSTLAAYRKRLTEGTDISIPEVNGWELTSLESRSKDPDDAVLPTNIITEIEWSNGESTTITAKWRGSYNCWRLAVPIEGAICQENVDDYLYEIDVPQRAVQTSTILMYAREAMETLNPDNFQDPYDLRDGLTTDEVATRHAKFAPVALPEEVGDWEVTERRANQIVWENTNGSSPWKDFAVKLDTHGGFTVKNTASRSHHGGRTVEKHAPSGESFSTNIDKNYGWRRREMFDENWFYCIGFMAETSRTRVSRSVRALIQETEQAPYSLVEIDHGISTDPHKTMDRENGSLLAY